MSTNDIDDRLKGLRALMRNRRDDDHRPGEESVDCATIEIFGKITEQLEATLATIAAQADELEALRRRVWELEKRVMPGELP